MAACIVSFVDLDGVRHSVEVEADGLYEASVLDLCAFREHEVEPGGFDSTAGRGPQLSYAQINGYEGSTAFAVTLRHHSKSLATGLPAIVIEGTISECQDKQ